MTSDSLKALIQSLLSDKDELHKIENNARNMAVLDSRERIADIIVSLAEKN